MKVEGRDKVRTKSFTISFDGGELLVSMLPKIDTRQLRLKFKR